MAETTWTPERIKALRERLGWSQVRAAREVGVVSTAWCRWENGVCGPGGPASKMLGILEKKSLKKQRI